MLRITRACVVALILMGMGSAHAAPPAHQNGYFASATWRVMGSWPHEYWSQSVGPYLTYGDCYTAWMQMVNTYYPNYWLESTVPCHLVATHMAYATPSLMINDDGDDETGPTTFESLHELIGYVEQGRALRHQFRIDEYEAAVGRLR